MPPSQPCGRLPSKKRRSSSASASHHHLEEEEVVVASPTTLDKESAKPTASTTASTNASTAATEAKDSTTCVQEQTEIDNHPPKTASTEQQTSGTTIATAKTKIVESRLPSKKRKSSHDSTQQRPVATAVAATTAATSTTAESSTPSVQAINQGNDVKHKDSKEKNNRVEINETKDESLPIHAQPEEGNQLSLKKPPPSTTTTTATTKTTTTNNNTSEGIMEDTASVGGRSRKNSMDSLGMEGLRHFASDSPSSSPARIRLRSSSSSPTSLEDLPTKRQRLRSESQASLDFFAKQLPGSNGSGRLRSHSQASLDSFTKTRAESYTSMDSMVRRLRSGSTTSIEDAFFRRKFSEDMSALDIFGPPPPNITTNTTTASTTTTNTNNNKNRKESHDTTSTTTSSRGLKMDVLFDHPPPPSLPQQDEPININPKIGEFEVPVARPRSNSTASLVNEGHSVTGGENGTIAAAASGAGAALEHLNALADETTKPAAKKRRDSTETDDNSSGAETFVSTGHRVLLEAIKLTMGEGGEVDLGSKEGSQEAASLQPRGRLESWGGAGRERFESLGSVLEAAAFASKGRDRLESWGGMSDLSINFGASAGGSSGDRGAMSSAAAAAAAAAAAVAEQFELAGGVEEIAGLGLFDDQSRQRTSSIPSRISLERDRFNSIASFSEASFLPEGAEVTIDLNSIVAAAMAHVGDLAELAGIVENVAAGSEGEGREADASEASSTASPMIGAMAEGLDRHRNRSLSISSKVSVDYEALAAAVDAAQAAAGNIDLDGLCRADDSSSADDKSRKDKSGHRWRRQLPLKRDRTASEISDEKRAAAGQVSETEMERIRKRARLAAEGKVSSRKKQATPGKKRTKRQNASTPQPDIGPLSSSPTATPRVSNKAIAAADEMPEVPLSSVEKSASKGQASQKWDSMFDALLAYIEERRQEETTDFSEEERKEWSWDGNVPTTYKTADGKALGRWVNNQRSAKSKGSLKPDREDRLIQAGLKWSVLASNSWNETLEELRNYIREQTKDGKEWDGNVPTHYQIKAKPNGKFAGEDKNLGRWVNRQRSLYQAGRLRKDRQLALEKLGLKWSMLSSTSWDAMFETLKEYVAERKKREGSWDGNVPANFRTTDNPPRALGRWINRQRSAYTKGKLKSEYVDKLNAIGLKWSVHEKNGLSNRNAQEEDRDDFDNSGGEEDATPVEVASSETAAKENDKNVAPAPAKIVSSTAPVEEAAAALPDTKAPVQTPMSAN